MKALKAKSGTYLQYTVKGGTRTPKTFNKAEAMLRKDGYKVADWTVYDHREVTEGYQVDFLLQSEIRSKRTVA